MNAFLAAGLVVAVIAAVRGLWSPCGLSMISSITPMTEQSRGNRFAVTALWFVAGSVLGGATLGAFIAIGALGVGLLQLSAEVRATIALVGAAVTIGSDVKIAGRSLWNHPRQVDEMWLGRMRAWAYAAGFGWQIGAGVTTYIMTSAVYLLIVVGFMSGSPLAALGMGVAFGVVRGLGVYCAGHVTTPDALRSLHRRIEALEPSSRAIAVLAQVVAVGVLVTVAPRALAIPLGAVAVIVALWGLITGRESSCELEPRGAVGPEHT